MGFDNLSAEITILVFGFMSLEEIICMRRVCPDCVGAWKGDAIVILAAWLGLESVVRKSLADGMQVNMSHDRLGSVLYAAAFNDDESLARLLIETAPMIRKGGTASLGGRRRQKNIFSSRGVRHWVRTLWNPFGAAASAGHETIVRLFLQRKSTKPNLRNPQQRSPLFLSARSGRTGVVRLLLGLKSVDPDAVDHCGDTPLSAAIEEKWEPVVRILLECDDVCVDYTGLGAISPLLLAADRGYARIVGLLLKRPDVKVNGGGFLPPIIAALNKKHAEVVELLLKRKEIDLHYSDIKIRLLRWAASHGLTRMAKLLLESHQTDPNSQRGVGMTLLHIAAIHNRVDVVKLLLLRKETNPNCEDAEGKTALHIAAIYNTVDVVKLLLQRKETDPNCEDAKGKTPLMTATMRNYVGIVRLLLEDSRTVHDRSDRHGMTPLMHASWKGYLEILHLINLNTSNPNLQERLRMTALHLAASKSVAGAVGLLPSRDDIDPNSQDYKGNTPLHRAIKSGDKRVIELLLDREMSTRTDTTELR